MTWGWNLIWQNTSNCWLLWGSSCFNAGNVTLFSKNQLSSVVKRRPATSGGQMLNLLNEVCSSFLFFCLNESKIKAFLKLKCDSSQCISVKPWSITWLVVLATSYKSKANLEEVWSDCGRNYFKTSHSWLQAVLHTNLNSFHTSHSHFQHVHLVLRTPMIFQTLQKNLKSSTPEISKYIKKKSLYLLISGQTQD